ncbi:MAG TPA: PKD domain-containing protein [Streptosporangiaceae bacterium]|jgi:PKD repeat protein|nr:PKD domain-containing protein [Streptosporangiaceae bacterium]
MPRYEFGPLVRHATGPVLAVLALLAAVVTSPAMTAAAAQASPATSRSAATSVSPLAVPLEQAFAAARHLPAAAIGGVRSGTLHQGSAAGIDWALASFVPATSAGKLAAGFADGAATGVFRRSGGVWHLVRTGPYGCGAGLPASLKQTWRLADPATCSASVATGYAAAQHALTALPAATGLRQAIASIALRQVGVSTTPAETSFSGVDCNPFTTLVAGFSANADGCGRDQHFGVEDENEEWCSDFNKWVWQQAGVTADMGTLNAAASSFYGWGQEQGETLAPGQGKPQVGDSIAFFGPGPVSAAAYADHVGVVTSVNADGTINMVNGDFLGSSQISVEYNTNLDLGTWPASEWGAGEQWVIITPPANAQPPVPHATITGPHAAATGTAASFHATASEPGGWVSQYYWTFGDGRSANSTAGATVSHVFHETGTYTVTVTVTSSRGPIRTLTWDVVVNGASSAAAGVPSNAVWYATAPVDEYLFTRSAGGLAADLWDGASWLQVTVPGQPAGGGPVTALSYPDPAVSDAMTPHAYYRAADGSLAETWLGAAGWVTRELPGQPEAGSAITAAFTGGEPAVFYVAAGGRLAETSQQASGWTATRLPGVPVRPASLTLAATAAGPVLVSTTSGDGLQVTGRDGAHWSSAPLPVHPVPDQPLAAATTSVGQPRVFFTSRGGGLAAATRSGGGRWTAAGLPGRPAHGAALAATSYLIPGPPVPGTPPASTTPPGSEPPGSLPEGRIGDTTGQEVFYLGAGGHPAVDYSTTTGGWRTATLPGPASGIVGADAYPLPDLPAQLFVSVPGGGLQADTTGSGADPSSTWSAAPLPAVVATMADRVVLYAATASDAATAHAAASAAGLPAAQVTQSFATAWADTLSGNYLVIAVGQAATGALDYNECGWVNPSTAVGGSTPFYIVAGPLGALPGADAYESGTAADAVQTQARTTDLAWYAVHGALPTGVTALPAAASPQRACSGSPS